MAAIWFFDPSGTVDSSKDARLKPRDRLPNLFCAKTLVLAAVLAGLMASPAGAAVTRRHRAAVPAGQARITPMPAGATDPDKDAALIIDGATGKTLYARNETLERHPASLTKMMTLYLLFEALKQGKVTMQTQMPVSLHAQQQKPTKLSLRHGQTIDVDTAIRAIVIRSANDVAVVIAEALGGTESHFAEMMNEKARQLGMKETNYHNASGLPDPLQITTASDLAILARHLAYDFPQYFPYFGTTGFTYKGVFYPTHDNLVGRYPGADGIKTGYVGASGFNLASSVVRDGVHLIGIVMGGRTALRRDLEMMNLMDREFTDIAAQPTLVAHAQVPWQAVASATPAPALAGFTLAPSAGGYTTTQMAALSAPPPPQLSAVPPAPLPADADEDAAEAHRAPDENYAVIHAEAPALASAAIAPQPAPAKPAPALPAARQMPAPKPAPLMVMAKPAAKPQQMASASKPVPQPAPAKAAGPPRPQQVASAAPKPAAPAPALRPQIAADQAPADHNWTIQIGAFGNQTLAQAQLSSFVAKAKDVIGAGGPIVAPIQSANGHTLYRARFGPYAEREARNVCSQLTQRGEPCFAVVSR
jgi:D-alanyl-D-alanine carboxypeptidase